MSKQLDSAKRLYVKLSQSERTELKTFIRESDPELETKTFTQLNEWLNKKSLGPMSAEGVCTCCQGTGRA